LHMQGLICNKKNRGTKKPKTYKLTGTKMMFKP
jgi:hypothetical protein